MIAIFAGTFDPFTAGHRDIAEQALATFGNVIIAVAVDTGKSAASLTDRISIAKLATADLSGVTVEGFEGLLTDYAESKGDCVLVRGIRSARDLEYERELTAVYRSLGNTQSVFFIPHADREHISSSVVRTLAALGADLKNYTVVGTTELIARSYGIKHGKGEL